MLRVSCISKPILEENYASSAPELAKKFVAGDQQEGDRDVVAEAVFAGLRV
jgi:hypothetical protein